MEGAGEFKALGFGGSKVRESFGLRRVLGLGRGVLGRGYFKIDHYYKAGKKTQKIGPKKRSI